MTLVKRYNRKPETLNLFDSFFGRDFYWEPETFFNRTGGKPAVNISETDDAYLLEIVAPGYSKDEFSIELNKNMLTVAAEKQTETNSNEEYRLQEFHLSKFKRQFELAENKIDDSSINANYEAGILSIKLNKKEEAKPKPKRIINIA